MGRQLVGNHAFPHILPVRKPQMLFSGYIAKHGAAKLADDRPSDSSGNMVVTGGDVRYQRTQRTNPGAPNSDNTRRRIAYWEGILSK